MIPKYNVNNPKWAGKYWKTFRAKHMQISIYVYKQVFVHVVIEVYSHSQIIGITLTNHVNSDEE